MDMFLVKDVLKTINYRIIGFKPTFYVLEMWE